MRARDISRARVAHCSRTCPVAAVGAAGNAWITSAVYQPLVGIIDDHLDPQAALELPRFLPGARAAADGGITVELEDGFSPDVMRRLASLGYRTRLSRSLAVHLHRRIHRRLDWGQVG